ncbi:hypothetical protein NMG60_11036304 [Bertholletia excelsa]
MTCIEMAFFPANFMLQTPQEDDRHHHHQHPTSLSSLLPPCTPQDFHGVASLLGKRSMSYSGMEVGGDHEEANINGEEELSDDGSQMLGGEKKRRLNVEQVRTLEKNFELGNKLEPERKMQLARALGLQPRQIAIWFQNRRARWKTKQLEKDYEVLKRQFDALKADNDALQTQNHKLQAEILALKSREPTESINLNKETEGSSSNRSEDSSDVGVNKLDINASSSMTPPPVDESTPLPNHPLSSCRTQPIYPPSMRPPPPSVAHLFHSQKNIDQPSSVKEESSFCNMFCGIDDQTAFWPWLEHQHFN